MSCFHCQYLLPTHRKENLWDLKFIYGLSNRDWLSIEFQFVQIGQYIQLHLEFQPYQQGVEESRFLERPKEAKDSYFTRFFRKNMLTNGINRWDSLGYRDTVTFVESFIPSTYRYRIHVNYLTDTF